ncbi:hypothetical protein DM02DRAFT_415852 [Periconia macrospinosa]|uniref:Uncharacterized protein n=1 Tax=Periconia macrospinosa TaxID=97972 RepID=A0A2V1DNX2_9PLEO|nr:hypothetical protein DM02DRAFT_415852 [Periconia macrospinosa]
MNRNGHPNIELTHPLQQLFILHQSWQSENYGRLVHDRYFPYPDRRSAPSLEPTYHRAHHIGSYMEKRELHGTTPHQSLRNPFTCTNHVFLSCRLLREVPNARGYGWIGRRLTTSCFRLYNPEPELGLIEAPLPTVNTTDDLMNPPEPNLLEQLIKTKMKRGVGKAVIVPRSNETYGHGTYIEASIWKDELALLLAAVDDAKSNCTL